MFLEEAAVVPIDIPTFLHDSREPYAKGNLQARGTERSSSTPTQNRSQNSGDLTRTQLALFPTDNPCSFAPAPKKKNSSEQMGGSSLEESKE